MAHVPRTVGFGCQTGSAVLCSLWTTIIAASDGGCCAGGWMYWWESRERHLHQTASKAARMPGGISKGTCTGVVARLRLLRLPWTKAKCMHAWVAWLHGHAAHYRPHSAPERTSKAGLRERQPGNELSGSVSLYSSSCSKRISSGGEVET